MSIRIPVANSSGQKTANALIQTGFTLVSVIVVFTDGTHDATITVYDNVEASGKIVWGPHTIAAADNAGGRPIGSAPIKCENGVYAVISGTGATYIIEYIQTSIGMMTSKWEHQ
jgi:hypothetical protein